MTALDYVAGVVAVVMVVGCLILATRAPRREKP